MLHSESCLTFEKINQLYSYSTALKEGNQSFNSYKDLNNSSLFQPFMHRISLSFLLHRTS